MDDGWGWRGGAAEAEGGEETKLREEPEAEADKRRGWMAAQEEA
jgi:hypothetical protein